MRIFFFLSSLFCAFLINAQITISEISYNPPESNADSLEYIELYNLSTDPVDLSGWSFSEGVRLDSFDFTMEGGAYALIAINARAVKTVFGVDADMVWEEGALRNGGESITLVNAVGETVVSLTYADDGDWPSEADGTDSAGGSIELCDVNADPSDGTNWRVSMGSTGVVINGNEVLGTPRQANSVTCEVQPAVEIVGVGVTWTPADVTINLGETVRWINGGGTHNVNGTLAAYPDNPEGFGNGSPSSDPWVYDYTFTVAGVYDYKCDLHEGAGMLGTVTVIDPNVVIPDLVITEIMYNDPGENDELEFIEIFNNSDESVNLDGVSFSSGVNHTFSGESIAAQSTMILCKDAAAFERTFGFTAMAWAEGDLDNMGETLSLMDGSGNTIDQVTYGVDGDWPAEANGGGSSLVLCNISGDNNDGANWRFLDMEPAFQDGSISVFASPGQLLPCAVDVATVTQVDEMGVNTWLGSRVVLSGLVYSPNFRSSGVEFTLIDSNGDGINIYSTSNINYEPELGNQLAAYGTIGQFNGLNRLFVDSVRVVGQEMLEEAVLVTTLDESTESQLIRFENVSLVDPAEWTNEGGGFNVEMTDGTNTFTVRIDRDIDLFGRGYPTGTFSIVGIGSQFDGQAPFDEGYQMFPRFVSDIDPFNEFVIQYQPVEIDVVNDVDAATGIALSLGEPVEVNGIVYGTNLRPSGLQFTLIDANNNGIGINRFDDNLGYTVAEGDQLTIRGFVEQFSGLTRIAVDELVVNSSGNSLVEPREVNQLNESTESSFLVIKNFSFVDPSQWRADGNGFSVDITNGSVNLQMRIDSDSPLSTMAIPPFTNFDMIGIGGQFDTSDPLLDGYQISPRYIEDFSAAGVNTKEIDIDVSFYPNPVIDQITILYDGTSLNGEVRDVKGSLVLRVSDIKRSIDVRHLQSGLYYLSLFNDQGLKVMPFFKE